MKNIVDLYSKVNIDALFEIYSNEIYSNPVEYVIKTGFKILQNYVKNEDITHKADTKTLKYVYNICDHVLYEDDESIKKLWANLLLNSIDEKSNIQMKNIFINILANIDSDSAKFFEQLISQYIPVDHDGAWSEYHRQDLRTESAYVLKSLGLIDSNGSSYSITPLGKSFYSAVSRK